MFARPGITALRDQAVADVLVETGLPTLLRRSPLRALAYAQAGLAYGQYGYLDWIARQSVPFTGTGVFLEAWAALVDVQRKPASPASGTVAFVGVPGATVPIGTLLRRGDGFGYATTGAVTLGAAGTGSLPVQAQIAGSALTLQPNTPLTLAAPIVGVQSGAVAQPVTPGADPELDAPFRTRMLLRWASPPQGGDATDYVEWALAVPGVTRAWVNPIGAGEGTVVVYTMWDQAEAPHGGFPQGRDGVTDLDWRGEPAMGDQLTVALSIYPRRPVTALVYSVAPGRYPVPFAIHTPAPVSAVAQAAAVAALTRVFLDVADPLGGTVPLGLFDQAITNALSTPLFTLTTPTAAIMAPLGSLPILGAITWTGGNG